MAGFILVKIIMIKLKLVYRYLVTIFFWKFLFSEIGSKCVIYKPILLVPMNRIRLGNRVVIRENSRIEIVPRPDKNWSSEIIIGDHVNIEQGSHIISQGQLIISKNVSIGPYVCILNAYHPYIGIDELQKYGDQLPDVKTSIEIGEGTLIGAHSVILHNVKIGKKCIIGACTLVNCDIPDYSVAIGVPAKIHSRIS
ncbi:acyltransferase [Polynucleobacter sp. UK-Gri1-W3]|uniref:acyltransferase n=1 Tax=Polynucleobacter sp. UK-Gri1-W3 TaxID=1819737 RepID=UPI001C0C4B5A|nr:acyltransferase [Polynucleobacter sp. UK-Gri1-W3]MBU3538249.1 acyltransferase [Polynucleobacter sp. UK-Gri1-W3]